MTSETLDVGVAESRRGRPRTPGVGLRVRSAAINELIENGLEGFSISKVARRAGVAKGTVSLRWPDPLELVLEALASTLIWPEVPDTGDLAQELMTVSRRLDPAYSAPLFGLLQSALGASTARPEAWKRWRESIVEGGMALTRAVFDRAAARGDLSADADIPTLIKLFLGGLWLATQSKADLGPPNTADREAIISAVLQAGR